MMKNLLLIGILFVVLNIVCAHSTVSAQWSWLGPFPMASFERGMDVHFFEEATRMSQYTYMHELPRPDGKQYASELVLGGYVGWQQLRSSQDGMVNIPYNSLGAISFFGWAVGEFHVAEGACQQLRIHGSSIQALVAATALPSVKSDVAPALIQIPEYPAGVQFNFSKGTHTIWVKAKGQGGSVRFGLNVAACGRVEGQVQAIRMYPGDWQVGPRKWAEGPPAYDLPDVVDGRLFGDYVHLRVGNMGQSWVSNVTLQVLPGGHVQQGWSPHPVALAPGQRTVLYAPLAFHQHNVSSIESSNCPLVVWLRVHGEPYGAVSNEAVKVELRCRGREESFLFTFIDADGSPQPAAARAPKKECGHKSKEEGTRRGTCGILLSMHGMDVTALRQADAYRSKPHLWLLAPHGRATHSFFWQGPGQWNAERALAALQVYSRRWLDGRYAAGRRRIITGHSNGGYGALLMAALEPAYTLGLAPLAGMTMLGDSGREGSWASLGAHPMLEAVMSGTVCEYRTDLLAVNLRGIPMLARTGADDEVISPHLTRRVGKMVCLAGGAPNASECGIKEMKGKGHWWWDTHKPSDGGVLDDSEMRRFWTRAYHQSKFDLSSAHTQVAPAKRQSEKLGGMGDWRRWADGEEQVVVCWETASCGVIAGVRVTQMQRRGQSARVSVAYNSSEAVVRVSTRNVLRLALADARMLAAASAEMRIVIDGVAMPLDTQGHLVCRSDAHATDTDESDGIAVHGEESFCLEERGDGLVEGNGRPRWIGCKGTTACRQERASQKTSGEVDDEGSVRGHSCCVEAHNERIGSRGAGPLRRFLARPFVCVYGTSAGAAMQFRYVEAAQHLAGRWFESGGGVTHVMSDVQVLQWLKGDNRSGHVDLRSVNLVLLGGPDSNLVTVALADSIPVKWHGAGARMLVGPCVFDSQGQHGVVSLGPWGEGLLVVVAGQGPSGWYKASDLVLDGLFQVNHWQHRLPDVVVAGSEYGRRGVGGILLAGYWDRRWEWQEASSYAECDRMDLP